jgi:predicted small secreted protein
MKTRLASLVLTLASTLLAACGSTIVGGGGSDECFENCEETTTTGGGGSGGSGGSGPQTGDAVAMTRAQSDVLWEEYWENNDPSGSTGTTGGGEALDPNDLFIRLSSVGVSCGSPTVDLPCGGNWSVSLVLPPAFQQVGVYDLTSPELVLYSHMSETGTPNSATPGDCPWGGGSMGPGTLEIVSITATEVQFQLQVDSIWEANPNGVYTAPRCQ